MGQKVAQALHIAYYDKELLAVAAKKSGLSSQFMNTYDEKPTRSFLYSLVMGQWLEKAAASSLAAAPTMFCGMNWGF